MDSRKSHAIVRVVDDDPGVRESYKFLIESEGWLVKTYPDAESFLSGDDLTVPGCAIVDVRMPGMSGMALQLKLRELVNCLPVVFVSAHGDIEMAVKAMKRGAADFLAKPVADDKLLAAIDKAVTRSFELLDEMTDREALLRDWNSLSAREKEVALLLAEGLMNKVIADRLGISERTVQVHRANVCQKLGCRNAVGGSRAVDRLRDEKAIP
ncbi:MAG: response regulator [Sutterellaceae bacterium]|nr:response regulator [Sutterellaceae bacterium]MDY2867852.1 response regulator [Mesosutterella sp.]